MAAQRLQLRGALLDPEDDRIVAEVSCLVVIQDLGHWQGSLTVVKEDRSVWERWLAGQKEYVLDLAGHSPGSISLDPMEWLDPAARGCYTFRGLSLPPHLSSPPGK